MTTARKKISCVDTDLPIFCSKQAAAGKHNKRGNSIGHFCQNVALLHWVDRRCTDYRIAITTTIECHN